jgi:polyisoprenyl-phosphate glycosyltransferase
MPLISFILPIYNEESNIEKLWNELVSLKEKVINKIGNKSNNDVFTFEFIFINDGSRDKSLQILKSIYQKYNNEVKILSFGRNFGHQIAVTAGQHHASGDAIIIMDSDLQDPPEVCLELITKWQEGYDIVYAKRRLYEESWLKKLPAFLFYRLMSRIANINLPEDTGDFRLLSREVNNEMNKFTEHNRYLRGISFLTGFSTTEVLFDRAKRYGGKPMYTFSKSLKLAVDGITSFSLFPIRLVSILGIFCSSFGLICGTLYVILSLIIYSDKTIGGWASLMFGIIFMGGIQLLMLGVIGEYVGRIYTEVLNRPLYTIINSYGFDTNNK